MRTDWRQIALIWCLNHVFPDRYCFPNTVLSVLLSGLDRRLAIAPIGVNFFQYPRIKLLPEMPVVIFPTAESGNLFWIVLLEVFPDHLHNSTTIVLTNLEVS